MHGIGTARVAAAAAILLVGCVGELGATKAGGIGDTPITLRIGTSKLQGTPTSDQVEQFASRVNKLSAGNLLVEPVRQAAEDDAPDGDQQVARSLEAGGLALAVIPTWVWDTEGVTSMRALDPPFLITSDELVADVVSGELAGHMM
jgi:hypothetical protein